MELRVRRELEEVKKASQKATEEKKAAKNLEYQLSIRLRETRKRTDMAVRLETWRLNLGTRCIG